jgi:energy-converting hydrogenase Eha subunit E
MIEVLGFGGSGLIIASVTMRSIVHLRMVALAGSLLFLVYGAVLGAWPVAATNAVTTTVHLLYLLRIRTQMKGEPAPGSISRPTTTNRCRLGRGERSNRTR